MRHGDIRSASWPIAGRNIVQLSAETGELSVLVEELSEHVLHVTAPVAGTGRDLVAVMRINLGGAEQGASAMLSTVEEVE